jgi:hypothetical protein
MKIEYDREVDALYVRLQEKFVAKTVEVYEVPAAASKCIKSAGIKMHRLFDVTIGYLEGTSVIY